PHGPVAAAAQLPVPRRHAHARAARPGDRCADRPRDHRDHAGPVRAPGPDRATHPARHGHARHRREPRRRPPDGHRRQPHDHGGVRARQRARGDRRPALGRPLRPDRSAHGLRAGAEGVRRLRDRRRRLDPGRHARRLSARPGRGPVRRASAGRILRLSRRLRVRDPDRGAPGPAQRPARAQRGGAGVSAARWPPWLPGLVLIALGAAAVAVIEGLLSGYLVTLASIALIYVMLAVSLQVTNGLTGLFSLGHPAFMTIGAYVAAILTYPARRKGFRMPDLPEWLATQEWALLPAMLLRALVATLAALIVGYSVLRLKGHYLAVATLGLIIIVRVVINNLDGYTRGGLGLSGVARLADLWWVYAWTVLAVYVAWRIKHSSLGRAMLALRENEMAARCMGIDA